MLLILIIIAAVIGFEFGRKSSRDRSVKILKEDIFSLKEENKFLKMQLSLPPERRNLDIQTRCGPGPIEKDYNKHMSELATLKRRIRIDAPLPFVQFFLDRLYPLKKR